MELGSRQVEITIGTIVLEGLGRFDEGALCAGVEGELTRIIAARGLPDRLPGGARTLQAPPFDVPAAPSGAAFGAAVGQAVYGALGR